MRLLQVGRYNELVLTKDVTTPPGPYAILSHTWGADEEEVTFDDMENKTGAGKTGYVKLWFCANQARKDRLEYFWVDTCCINKQSSAELSEAINSMYNWYHGAKRCYVYLNDVVGTTWKKSISKSRWFKRGWTLQELLAPRRVIFYDRLWRRLGSKSALAGRIASITRIPATALTSRNLTEYSVAQKMSWSARRVTTRAEDGAYCLLGLFGVNMPLLYGEGQRAFFRLQEEIVKYNDDHSIFAWSMKEIKFSGLLAPSPVYFSRCHCVTSGESLDGRRPFAMTNRGLSISLKITPWAADTYLAYIDCTDRIMDQEPAAMGIFIRRLSQEDQYTRINIHQDGLWRYSRKASQSQDGPAEERLLYIRQNLSTDIERPYLNKNRYGFRLTRGWLPPSTRMHARNPSRDRHSAILHPGQWGAVLVLEFSLTSSSLRHAALGFDFDLYPVCLLRDSFAGDEEPDFVRHAPNEWSHLFMHSMDREEIFEGSKVYRRANHRGIWILAGHRSRGLDACLYAGLLDMTGSILTLKRDTSKVRPHWELHIDNLDGPFRRRVLEGRRNNCSGCIHSPSFKQEHTCGGDIAV
ncbi:hypothetical protein EPUS_09369 [Endocarpon pusillum Z07020]|uniref:Uncharacterized protein n=1 Tax=Endocarpon pusillum (strain Z07020 / HMAS-L-300199) TaxID=1263415 RepID=U1HJC8_ENDPU|nr:uncharacterized protein EPUS_09369 [Endocarpon pusillum Z07020]ERF70325.1 hypothetical protein EPUS_09369 [Endocarpon pusillum Z07020]